MNPTNSQQARAIFAQKIQQDAGIRSAALIHGLATVPREDFVGPGPWKIMRPGEIAKGYQLTPDDNPEHLYDKVLVALDAERRLNNGEPASLLSWLDILDLTAGDRFLHIGCGVGYYTAIAASAVGATGTVVGVEIDAPLAAHAERNLQPYTNVTVICGDGSAGVAGPFDAIFINAGCTHPQSAWLDQLSVGGRLLMPLTIAWPVPGLGSGFMLLVTRQEGDRYEARNAASVGIFHCVGSRSDENNKLLAQALTTKSPDAIRRLRRDEHAQGESCWLHGSGFCLSTQ